MIPEMMIWVHIKSGCEIPEMKLCVHIKSGYDSRDDVTRL